MKRRDALNPFNPFFSSPNLCESAKSVDRLSSSSVEMHPALALRARCESCVRELDAADTGEFRGMHGMRAGA